jgi:AcrR family transcriptional regulator
MKQDSKQEKILAAALTLFVSQGISETSTASIAKAAGVATGTLFHHFDSKQSLVHGLYQSLKLKLVTALADDIQEQPFDPLKVWRSAIHYGLNHAEEFNFFQLYYASPWVDESFKREMLETVFGFLLSHIKQEQAAGRAIALPCDLLAMHIQQTLLGVVQFLAKQTAHECESHQKTHEIIELSYQMLFAGIHLTH